jgi:hypothetical protein
MRFSPTSLSKLPGCCANNLARFYRYDDYDRTQWRFAPADSSLVDVRNSIDSITIEERFHRVGEFRSKTFGSKTLQIC